ncbi:MAG: hypothetical protein JSW62_01385 [Thermoplasmatales archaeon]|nr:MAG: hypothetical protein JSW62_01385 [Thermoplasmatales archaeon]
MNRRGSTGIAAAVLLISFLLISIIAASVIIGESQETTEQDLQQIADDVIDDVLNEITNYLQIKDLMGKCNINSDERKIEKIAILIKPLISNDIDASELIIKLCNGNDVKLINYSGNAEFIGSNSLFEHPIWDTVNGENFGFIVISDKDNSLDSDILNGDMVYIAIKLSGSFPMSKGDTMTMTLFPSSGIVRTINLKAPPPIESVVSFSNLV